MKIQPLLQVCAIGLTSRCNLSCDYCSRSDLAPVELSTSTIQDLLLEIEALNPHVHVPLSGGEPFLFSDWPGLLNVLRKHPSLSISINTNGTILDWGLIESISSLPQFRHFITSFDSSVGEHDKRFGRNTPGAYERFHSFVDGLRRRSIPFHVNVTLTPATFPSTLTTARYLKRLGASGISIARVYEIGKGRRENRISFDSFCSMARSIIAELRSPIFQVFVEDDCLRFFVDPEYGAQLRRDLSRILLEKKWRGCTAGKTMLHINPDGNVLACTFLNDPAGNIYSESLSDIWQSSSKLLRLRNLSLLQGECGKCLLRTVCGGCRARAFSESNDPMGFDFSCPGANDIRRWIENYDS